MSIIDWPLDKWLDNVALAALSRKETLLATYDLARSVIERDVPGDFVECGVYGGAQCAVMARAIMEPYRYDEAQMGASCWDAWSGRRVHLFDSFNGVPEPGPHDKVFRGGGWKAGEAAACSLEAVEEHMAEWGIQEELLVYHEGRFERTLATKEFTIWSLSCGIALLRIDADLYESTRICIEALYPLLSPGGWLIVDDYALDGCRKAVEEYFKGNYPPIYMQRMPT